MAIDYSAMRALAERLIAENGQEVNFYQTSGTPGDAAKPWRGTLTADTAITVMAAVVPVSEDDDPEAMRRGAATAYVAADVFGSGTGSSFAEAALEGFNRMVDAFGVTWNVSNVTIIAPGPVRVAYAIGLEH